MKIAWIVPGFSENERDWCIPALLDLARVMAARHELHIFALQYPYRRDRYSVFGATVHSIGGANRGRRALPGTWWAAVRAISAEHRRAPLDAVHAFWAYEPGVIAAWLRPRLRARTIVSVAGGELVWLPEIGYGLAGRRWPSRAVAWALRRADVVTAGSSGVVRLAQRVAGAQRVAFAPLGVDTQLFAPATSSPAGPVLITVGSLEPVKGQADLMRAFRFVVDRQLAARLMIIGSGRLQSELEALAVELQVRDQVEFTGQVRRERLPELLHRASVYVQSSLHEAQGMAVLEAAACGLAIVGTPVGALHDLAPESAITAPVGDPLRLAQAILAVLDDPAQRRALGEAARTRALADYGLDLAADRFEQQYAGPGM